MAESLRPMWRLVVAFIAVSLALSFAADTGWIGAIVFAALATIFAVVLKNAWAEKRWRTPWPYVAGFWLLPCVPTLVLVFRRWTLEKRARPGSHVRRSDTWAIARPIAFWYAAIGWLASRPPDPSPRRAWIFLGLAVIAGVAVVLVDFAGWIGLRSPAREAIDAGAVEAPASGVPLFDFGVGEGWTERNVVIGEAYRATTKPVAAYRGSRGDAARIVRGSLAWSIACLAFVTLFAVVTLAR